MFLGKDIVRNIAQPIRSQCALFLPPENIRKPKSFLMFSGVEKGWLEKNGLKQYCTPERACNFIF